LYKFSYKRTVMRIVNFSEARNKLKGLCDQLVKSRKPARIHRRGGDVVVGGGGLGLDPGNALPDLDPGRRGAHHGRR